MHTKQEYGSRIIMQICKIDLKRNTIGNEIIMQVLQVNMETR